MDNYPLVIAVATLVLLAAVVVVGYRAHRRAMAAESAQNRKRQQQITAFSAELTILKQELARKRDIADQLPRITKKMTEKLSADAYPAIAVRCIKEFFHTGLVGFFAPADGSTDYTLIVGAEFPHEWQGTIRLDAGEGILGMALRQKIVVSRTDPQLSPGGGNARGSLEGMGVTPDFVAPVFGVSGIVGAIVIAGCPFPLDAERVYVSMLADLLSTELQSAALLDLSRNSAWADHLTGVSNRLHFLQRFENEIRRTDNYRQALALLLFDVDEFKKINDTRGHHAGDVVLRTMADIVRRNTRESDLVGRYGGDEFMVLITSTNEERAFAFAEKLREMIAAADIAIPGGEAPVRITVSGGLAMYPSHGQSTTELLRSADDALYESKRQGRNRILVATSVGVECGIAKEAQSIQDLPDPNVIPIDAGSEAVDPPRENMRGDRNS